MKTQLDLIHRYQELAAQIAEERRACGLTVPVSASPETAPTQVAELAQIALVEVIPLLDALGGLQARLVPSGSGIDIDDLVLRLQERISLAATALGLPACEFAE